MFVCPRCSRVYPRPGHCPDDGTELSGGASPSLVGRTVGSYQVERLVGRGGMGEVYLAIHPEIGARVAIKVLSGDAARSPALVERFFAEAKAVNLIRHENIVSVLDMAKMSDGRPYLVMEYLEGAPLAEHFARWGNRMPLGMLCRLMREVLAALTAAHATGITHRDLKPENIFVTHAGRAKVLDFGVAKLHPDLGVAGPGTHSHALLGTPHYMAPEQARGLPADGRSDLYAIGVMLFEGATGQRPFHAECLYDLLEHHVRTPPPPPEVLRPDLPPGLAQAISRALAKDPARRFQSASELANALTQLAPLLGGAEVELPSSPTDRTLSAHPAAPTARTLDAATVSAHSHLSAVSAVTRTAVPSRWPWLFAALTALVFVLTLASVSAWLLFGKAPTPSAARAPIAPVKQIDLHSFDATAYLSTAHEQARQHFADAELVSITIPEVDHTGRVDLVAAQAHVGYSFRARGPGQGNPQAGVEIGDCVVNVVVSRSGVVTSRSQGMCNTLYVTLPRCTASDVMKKLGAQPGQRASLTYMNDFSTGPTWLTTMKAANETRQIPDGC